MGLPPELEGREVGGGLKDEGKGELIGSQSMTTHLKIEEKRIPWGVALAVATDEVIPGGAHGGVGGVSEERACVGKAAGGGEGAEAEQLAGEVFVAAEEAGGEDLGVDLAELGHGGAGLEEGEALLFS